MFKALFNKKVVQKRKFEEAVKTHSINLCQLYCELWVQVGLAQIINTEMYKLYIYVRL